MAFDKPTRNRLAAFVAEARRLITDEFTQQFQSLYGMSDASLTELVQLTHLDDAGLAVAGLLRERIDYLVKTHPEDKAGLKTAVDRLAREQAFTVLNRLAAVRMAEKRGLIAESVGKGYQSKGFKVFEQVARSGLGEIYQRYRRYLFCLFDELAIDLGVLFDRRSPQGLLFPRENTLLDLLNLLNGPELEPLWQEDETIGWIYQYYNDPAERKKMREESAAPRNSRELAVRNQFFTPRYVVEFLTDNTLGRIWYEMTRGETRLAEQCRYLVRRPTEIFLGLDETAPELPEQEGLSQEELLRQPVYIPHRPLKDPRQLRMLDPACGSMHFGLYAFDLYEVIYEEAWDRGMESLHADFPDRETLLHEIPRLIIEHNIHGIDIDPRAVQIAGLSLWLRAQRSWQQQRLPAQQRPQIRRSNIVCAEPMPGDKTMLREFIASQFAPEEQPAFTFLLERVFDRMALAGEAGSLLKIEEEISEAVREAKGLWKKGPQYRPGYLFAEAMPKKPEQLRLDLSGISEDGFWETVEEDIYASLRAYAEQAEAGVYQRRLFAEDAARGFAFIDLCRKQYDVVLMNPPFGKPAKRSLNYLQKTYSDDWKDIYASFFTRTQSTLTVRGLLGAITSLLFLYSKQLRSLRHLFIERERLIFIVELGGGVLDDATVETALSILSNEAIPKTAFLDLTKSTDKGSDLLRVSHGSEFQLRNLKDFTSIFGWPLCYHVQSRKMALWTHKGRLEPELAEIVAGNHTFNDFRFLRLRWEVDLAMIATSWVPYEKGGDFHPFFSPTSLLFNWANNGVEARAYQIGEYGTDAQTIQSITKWFKPGITYPRVSSVGFSPRVLPAGCIFSEKGMSIFPNESDERIPILGLLSSAWIEDLLCAFGRHRAYENSAVANLPFSKVTIENTHNKLTQLVNSAIRAIHGVATTIETSPFFSHVQELERNKALRTHALKTVTSSCDQIDEVVSGDLFPFDSRKEVYLVSDKRSDLFRKHVFEEEGEKEYSSNIVSFFFGIAFGRWDIRYATGEQPTPELTDPFAPLPICPPGMLQGEDGLPLPPEAGRQLYATGDYPLDIAWDGILVDDPGHPFDLEHRLRDVFTVLWGDRAEAIELEACELLGVNSLRDYFRKPVGFFADHLKRYSKSRRQAPIYWPLSTTKGSYTLWIYYHRLSDQTLHSALADFVDPKIKDVRAEISLLRESNNNRSRLEELLDLEGELLVFQAEIERIIKLPWQPNLNDGVLITAAPLWRLFRLPKWQKDLKACWDKLEKGEYDWAHLAYSIWPKRVEEVCKKDRSIAIAHGLEHLCQVEPPKPKAKRGRKKAE